MRSQCVPKTNPQSCGLSGARCETICVHQNPRSCVHQNQQRELVFRDTRSRVRNTMVYKIRGGHAVQNNMDPHKIPQSKKIAVLSTRIQLLLSKISFKSIRSRSCGLKSNKVCGHNIHAELSTFFWSHICSHKIETLWFKTNLQSCGLEVLKGYTKYRYSLVVRALWNAW